MTIVTAANSAVAYSTYYAHAYSAANLDSSVPSDWVGERKGSFSRIFGFMQVESYYNAKGEQACFFKQGPTLYRNEHGVTHLKQSSTVWPKEAGEFVVNGDCFVQYTGDLQTERCNLFVKKLDEVDMPSPFALGPYQECKVWREMSYEFKRSTWYPEGVTTVNVKFYGAVIDWSNQTMRMLYPQLSGSLQRKFRTPLDFFAYVESSTSCVCSSIAPRWSRVSISKIRMPRLSMQALSDALGSQNADAARVSRSRWPIGDWTASSLYTGSQAYEQQGQIVTKMAEQVGRMTDNNAALLIELAGLIREVAKALRGQPTSVSELIRSLRTCNSAKDAARVYANLRLSEQYGVKLTVRDCIDVWQHMQRLRSGESIARASASYSVCTNRGIITTDEHWKMFYSANPADAPVINRLFRSDFVGLENVWDLIPYSFVVDWGAPVGDTLSGWDDEWMLSSLPMKHIVVGQKVRMVSRFEHQDFVMETVTTRYERSSAESFPPYATATCRSVNTKTVLNGAALIVQRL